MLIKIFRPEEVGCTICIGRLILHELGKTLGAIIFNKIKIILWAFVRKKMRQKSHFDWTFGKV